MVANLCSSKWIASEKQLEVTRSCLENGDSNWEIAYVPSKNHCKVFLWDVRTFMHISDTAEMQPSPLMGHWFLLSLLIVGNYTTMALLQSKDILSMGQSWMLCKSRVAMETTIFLHTSTPIQWGSIQWVRILLAIASTGAFLNPRMSMTKTWGWD